MLSASLFVFFQSTYGRKLFSVPALAGGHKSIFAALCVVPALVPLVVSGPGGLAPAGVLGAAFSFLREPLAELFRQGLETFPRRGFRHRFSVQRPQLSAFLPNYAAGALGILFYGILSFLVHIPLFTVLSVLFCFAVCLSLPLRAEARQNRDIFSPIPMGKPPAAFFFPPVLPVFALAFVLVSLQSFQSAQLFQSFQSGQSMEDGYGSLPAADDFAEHASFQAAFSYRSPQGSETAGRYGTYSLGADGLIAEFSAYEENNPGLPAAHEEIQYPAELSALAAADTGLTGETGFLPVRKDRSCIIALCIMLSLSVPACILLPRKKKGTMVN
jgi:hypothetical protein